MAKYTIELTRDETGRMNVTSTLDGDFTSLELLGLLYWKLKDIQMQIYGDVRPDYVERSVIVESGIKPISTMTAAN